MDLQDQFCSCRDGLPVVEFLGGLRSFGLGFIPELSLPHFQLHH